MTRERERFDEAYYRRFYLDPKTRVGTEADRRRLGRFVASYLKYLRQPVRRVVDLGCGLGLWRDVVRREFKKAAYTGVETSVYLCKTYGWERGSVVDYSSSEPFDLVICQAVLQYLPAAEARRAIENLARLCRGALFLEVLTREDWQDNADQDRTDGDVFIRDARWYREALGEHFTNCGGGLFLSADSPAVTYELEVLRSTR